MEYEFSPPIKRTLIGIKHLQPSYLLSPLCGPGLCVGGLLDLLKLGFGACCVFFWFCRVSGFRAFATESGLHLGFTGFVRRVFCLNGVSRLKFKPAVWVTVPMANRTEQQPPTLDATDPYCPCVTKANNYGNISCNPKCCI